MLLTALGLPCTVAIHVYHTYRYNTSRWRFSEYNGVTRSQTESDHDEILDMGVIMLACLPCLEG